MFCIKQNNKNHNNIVFFSFFFVNLNKCSFEQYYGLKSIVKIQVGIFGMFSFLPMCVQNSTWGRRENTRKEKTFIIFLHHCHRSIIISQTIPSRVMVFKYPCYFSIDLLLQLQAKGNILYFFPTGIKHSIKMCLYFCHFSNKTEKIPQYIMRRLVYSCPKYNDKLIESPRMSSIKMSTIYVNLPEDHMFKHTPFEKKKYISNTEEYLFFYTDDDYFSNCGHFTIQFKK